MNPGRASVIFPSLSRGVRPAKALSSFGSVQKYGRWKGPLVWILYRFQLFTSLNLPWARFCAGRGDAVGGLQNVSPATSELWPRRVYGKVRDLSDNYVTKTDFQFVADSAVQTGVMEMGVSFGDVNEWPDGINATLIHHG